MNSREKQIFKCLFQASKKYTLLLASLGIITTHQIHGQKIEAPVVVSKKQQATIEQKVHVINTTSIYNDLRWRDISLTDEQPGISSKTELMIEHGFAETFASVKALSYNPKKQTITKTYTDIADIMTESKVGIKINPISSMSVALSGGIVMWPGGSIWINNATKTLTEIGKIKPVKIFEAEIDLLGFEITFNTGERTSIPYNQAASYEMWNEYMHVQHTPRKISEHYSFNLEYGYWKHTGRHFDFNLIYEFNKTISGIVKAYNFKGFRTYEPFDDDYGIIGIVQLKFQ